MPRDLQLRQHVVRVAFPKSLRLFQAPLLKGSALHTSQVDCLPITLVHSRLTLFVYNHSSTGGAPEQFATAWTAPTATVADAVNQITQAVFRACPDSKKLESYRTEAGDEYVRFAMNGKLGIDNVEFLIKNNGIGDRGWAGDDDRRNEWLVTYRSLATTVTYVYPFTTPVSDFGEQKKRMERIRNEVEWRRVGCEISEYCGGAFDLG